PHRHRIVAFRRDDFDSRAHAFNFRCADEHHLERRFAELAGADRAVDLTPVGVAANANVERSQTELVGIRDFLCQHDGARTGSECRLPAHEFLELRASLLAEALQKRARLSARDDETVDLIELLRLSDEYYLGAKFFETLLVG